MIGTWAATAEDKTAEDKTTEDKAADHAELGGARGIRQHGLYVLHGISLVGAGITTDVCNNDAPVEYEVDRSGGSGSRQAHV